MDQSGRILFVEDHPDVREALASLLEDSGYHVVAVGDAESGLAHLERDSGFDLLVTDHSLPGKDGAWLAQQAAALGLLERSRAIIVTALPNPTGCEGLTVMQKPLDVSAFLDEVAGRLTRASREGAIPATDCRVQLAFYMSSGSAHSHRALQSLQSALSQMDPGGFCLDVCDLAQGSHDEAERDKVSYTPTLVKRGPGARSWVVGDLHDAEKLAAVLGAWGVSVKERSAR